MSSMHFWARARTRFQRTAARALFSRPFVVHSAVPIVSFTFDDFPRSALLTGGAILKRFGFAGTYYASLGLMGKETDTGPIFVREDLRALLGEGHELGSHTFSHCHAWETKPQVFEQSVIENQRALGELCPEASFETLSYPIGPPWPLTKRRVGGQFLCCRGGGQMFNAGRTDLNFLRAFFLDRRTTDLRSVSDVIGKNRDAKGWLIFATHDVSQTPTAFGCTPELFEEVVRCAISSGARILPVIQAWRALAVGKV